MDINFRLCKSDDLHTLSDVSHRTYYESFSNMNTPSNMKAYLDESFNIDKMRDELSNSNSFFYFLYADKKLAGYLKLNIAPAQTNINDKDSLEIERIYVTKEFQGKGLGKVLMDKVINLANLHKKSYVWLGVWEKNDMAIRFYKKNGFYAVGTHSFFMGEEEQRDFIMRKNL